MIIKQSLLQAIDSGNAVLFVGAGVGHNVTNDSGSNAPDALELRNRLGEEFEVPGYEDLELTDVAQYAEMKSSREKLLQFVKQQLEGYRPDETLKWITKIRWKAIFTTNYDDYLEEAYRSSSCSKQEPIPFTLTSQLRSLNTPYEVPIYHLHGRLFGDVDNPITITEKDYATFSDSRAQIFSRFKDSLTESLILYYGYSNKDPNWRKLLTEIRREFYPSKLPNSFRIDPYPVPARAEILKKQDNIETLGIDLAKFRDCLEEHWKTVGEFPTSVNKERRIPEIFCDIYKSNPVPVSRFIRNWDHMNTHPLHSKENSSSFLKGEPANWELIADGGFFQRDLEEEIYEKILDFITHSKPRCKQTILLGSAGDGVTTLLKAVTMRIVRDNASNVFWLREGEELNHGDVEFAILNSDKRCVFIIDNSVGVLRDLIPTIQVCRQEPHNVFFLLGDRLNQWRATRSTPKIDELLLGSLSDTEIPRLLCLLEEKGSLGAIENLPHDLRIATIEEKHQNNLLVTLREVTEGRSFDAIIQNEFSGIASPVAKEAYLTVSCATQYGGFMRMRLLSEMMNISITDLYSDLSTYAEGVLRFETLNEYTGTEGVAARHRVIAEIVCRRCGGDEIYNRVMLRLIGNLNVMFKEDRGLFNRLIQDDLAVDAISNYKDRTSFFQTACRKEPHNGYVRQHFARMAYRAGKLVEGAAIIEEAIELGPDERMFYHTKGLIWSQRCIEEKSIPLSTRYYVLAEQAFKIGLDKKENDEYCSHGLASLYFEYGLKLPDDAERGRYIAKAEEFISNAIRKSPIKERLWLLSAKIEKQVGSQPASLAALNKAVESNPDSAYSRYMLARHYNANKEWQKSIELLEPIIKKDLSEPRPFIQYAISIFAGEGNLDKAIAVLRMAETDGIRDPQYLATLGGMLYLNHEYDEAFKTFRTSGGHWFPEEERRKVMFRPRAIFESKAYSNWNGVVGSVGLGFSFIRADEPKGFFFGKTRLGSRVLRPKDKVLFSPSFSAKGPVAENVELSISGSIVANVPKSLKPKSF